MKALQELVPNANKVLTQFIYKKLKNNTINKSQLYFFSPNLLLLFDRGGSSVIYEVRGKLRALWSRGEAPGIRTWGDTCCSVYCGGIKEKI